ncbi:MAG: esterase/lipase family protein [Myxococcales bacterium]
MASGRSVAWFLLAGAVACGHELPLSTGGGGEAPVAVPADAGAADAEAPTVLDGGWGPPYPIVLAHGFAGWDQVGPVEYFYQVPELLRGDGHVVYVAQVSPFDDSTSRGEQLLAYVQAVLAQSGAAKVDIVAHSQGGLDARYVAHAYPEGVAAVVTIATPHRGTPLADAAVSGTGGAAAFGALEQIAGAVDDGGVPEGFLAALQQMSSAGAAQFNQRITDAPGVAYFSIAGRSNLAGAGGDCQADEPGFISRWDAYADPTGPEFLFTGPYLAGNPLDPTPNDGLVDVASTKWGTFLGCVPADHFEEIGQILGQPAGPGNPFAYRDFYRELADWLARRGY